MVCVQILATRWPFSKSSSCPSRLSQEGTYIYSFYASLCILTLPSDAPGWCGKPKGADIEWCVIIIPPNDCESL